jgi:ribosomal protein S18 acetylase RimI-like enzyme
MAGIIVPSGFGGYCVAVAFAVVAARFPQDRDDVVALFREYAAGLGFDLAFQGFEAELAELPGEYAPPGGALLLARDEASALGCVALRRIDATTCEMKRLYVRSGGRGSGLGRRLAEAILDEARRKQYRFMRLDTVPSMANAIALYRRIGFREIEPYRFNPIEGALYMEVTL